MGAAASIQQIYGTAVQWFKQYFDEDMYVDDFKTIDKDNSGAITLKELSLWIQDKAQKEGSGPWAHLMHTPEVLQLAHTVAGRHRQCAQQVVDLNDFRALLVNLFVLSVLHVHFSMADDWREGNDFGNKTLSFSEFRLACRSVSAAHANEEITEEQLAKDFAMLDTNHNNSIAFVEVCDYCCGVVGKVIFANDGQNEFFSHSLEQMIDENDAPGLFLSLPASPRGEDISRLSEPCIEIKNELAGNLTIDRTLSVELRNSIAIAALDDHLQNQKNVANFVEVKHNTENDLLRAISGQMQ